MPWGNDFDMSAAADTLSTDLFGTDGELSVGEELPETDPPASDPPAGTPTTTAEPQPAQPQAPAAVPPTTGTEPPAVTPPDTPPPPKTWRADAAKHWAALPPEARQEVLKREEDMFRGLEQYRADATFAKGIKEAIAPFDPLLRQYNINPVQHIGALMKAHHDLATGTPEAKADMFRKLASDYGVDLEALALQTPPYVDPQVQSLRAELRSVQSTLSNAERERQAALQAENVRQIEAFAADPAHVHFDKVANDMADLLQKGVCKTLGEAYERAIWINPETRAAEISRQHAEKIKQGQAEATRRAEEARRAASANVKARAKAGSGTAAPRSMDETLQETLAAIQSRT